MSDVATTFDALAAEAGEIFPKIDDVGAGPARIALEVRTLPLGDLSDDIFDFAAVDGWIAFRSETAMVRDLELPVSRTDSREILHALDDTGRVVTGHGPVLAAELANGAMGGMRIQHLGGGEARVETVFESPDGPDPVIARPRRMLGEQGLALLYMEYWTVPDDGAARPIAARLVDITPWDKEGR